MVNNNGNLDSGWRCVFCVINHWTRPANTTGWSNAHTMMGQRNICWPGIQVVLGRVLFSCYVGNTRLDWLSPSAVYSIIHRGRPSPGPVKWSHIKTYPPSPPQGCITALYLLCLQPVHPPQRLYHCLVSIALASRTPTTVFVSLPCIYCVCNPSPTTEIVSLPCIDCVRNPYTHHSICITALYLLCLQPVHPPQRLYHCLVSIVFATRTPTTVFVSLPCIYCVCNPYTHHRECITALYLLCSQPVHPPQYLYHCPVSIVSATRTPTTEIVSLPCIYCVRNPYTHHSICITACDSVCNPSTHHIDCITVLYLLCLQPVHPPHRLYYCPVSIVFATRPLTT